eukprot:6208267-Pleurochrysis_carterae.AAC.1
MRRALEKCKNLMNDKQNYDEGVIQTDKAIHAIEQPRRHMNPKIKKEEELAVSQMISGIILEWQEANDKEKTKTITMLRLWTEENDELGEDTDKNVDRQEEQTQSQCSTKIDGKTAGK